VQKAIDELGYSDLVSLDEGLKKTVEWYLKHPERMK
jgi:nucleoside-diphosphate-sugar epimerase